MARPGTYGDGIMLSVASRFYNRQVIIHFADNTETKLADDRFGDLCSPIRLGFIRKENSKERNHYVCIRRKSLFPLSVESNSPLKTCKSNISTDELEVDVELDEELCENNEKSLKRTSVERSNDENAEKRLRGADSYLQETPDCDNDYPKVCRNRDQFRAWQKTRPWLQMAQNGGVACQYCSIVKLSGISISKGERYQDTFVTGTSPLVKDAKCLLKKIDKHKSSKIHAKSEQACKMRDEGKIESSFSSAENIFYRDHAKDIEATEKVFRTAYECAKSDLSFSEFTRLLDLQTANGVNWGSCLYSYHSCSNIVSHIGREMLNDIVSYLKTSQSKFSILVDESTSVSHKQSMIVYIKLLFNEEPVTYFLALCELTDTSATSLYHTLFDFLKSIGFSDVLLQEQLIGFCSDGASNMIGHFRGLATLMARDYPLLSTFHCMAHRLELAIKNAVADVNCMSHFSDLIDSIYRVYSVSPKSQREIDAVAESLSVELLKVRKIFDLRWIFSSFTALRALWRNLPALYKHFSLCSTDPARNTKERSKFSGLEKKIKSWLILAQLALLKDCARVLKQLSLYFQKDLSNVIECKEYIDTAKEKLHAMKVINGKTLAKFLLSSSRTGACKGIALNKNESDEETFSRQRAQFCQALFDNLLQRFPSCQLLSAAQVLRKESLPKDQLERALFGDSEIAYLGKAIGFTKEMCCEALQEYSIWKKTGVIKSKLNSLIITLECLPISTAACERGFSAMNLIHTKIRNRLDTSSVERILMIKINGPPLSAWNPRKYVITWLKQGKHSSQDSVPRQSKEQPDIPTACKIFLQHSETQ